MTDKTLKILLGIIAVNLTFQTVKDVGLFPTAYAQNDVQPAMGLGMVINILVSETWIQLTRTPGNGNRHWRDLDTV